MGYAPIKDEKIMPKNKWNIIWSGCYPGDIDEDEYGPYTKTKCERGVAELGNTEDLIEWYEHRAVDFGELGGGFHIHGGWIGSFNDLKRGKTYFLSEKEIARSMDSYEEAMKREKEDRKIWAEG